MNKDKLSAVIKHLTSQSVSFVDDELGHICRYAEHHIDNFTDEDKDWVCENSGYIAATYVEALESLVITDIVETINQTIAEPI